MYTKKIPFIFGVLALLVLLVLFITSPFLPFKYISTPKTILLGISTLIFAGFVFYISHTMLILLYERKPSQTDKFFVILLRSLRQEVLHDFQDVINIYMGLDLSVEDIEYRKGLSELLRQFLIKLVEGTFYKEESPSTEEIKKYMKTINEFIAKNEAEAPFANLPSIERSIITDLSSYIEAADAENSLRKVDELAKAIQIRADETSKVSRVNRWSVPLAITGVICTVIFGLSSILVILQSEKSVLDKALKDNPTVTSEHSSQVEDTTIGNINDYNNLD